MTLFALVLATQALDVLALMLALPTGHEANPLMSALLAAGGMGAVLAVKLGIGGMVAAVLARRRPDLAPAFGIVGCVGALSALVVRLGA